MPTRVLCERITEGDRHRGDDLDPCARPRAARDRRRNIGLVSPHNDRYQAKVVAAFEKRGYPCVAEAHAGFSDNFSYCTVPDADIVAMIRKVAPPSPPRS
jgi:maleate isomerase